MTPDGCLVSEDLFKEVVFELLASSSLGRYQRKAVELSIRAGLDKLDEAILTERLQCLWEVLTRDGQEERPLEEVEAALVAVALLQVAPSAPQLKAVRDFPCSNAHPGTPWVTMLVRSFTDQHPG